MLLRKSWVFNFLIINMNDEKLDKIIKLLENINNKLPRRSKTKDFLSWVFNHFFQLLTLFTLSYAVFQIWSVVDSISSVVFSLGEKFSGGFKNLF